MKLMLTVEIRPITDLTSHGELSKLPKDIQLAITKMPATERNTRSLLWVEGFPPRIIDSKTVSRYFPMTVARTFQDALQLLRSSGTLRMSDGSVRIYWSEKNKAFLDQNGADWVPTPDQILSTKEVWYVDSKNQPDPEEAELPRL